MSNGEKFIMKAIKRHGNKYDYSKVNYINSQTKVCIICPEHGEFWQTPSAHVRGDECPKCANLKRGSKKRWTIDDFLHRAGEVHGNKYDYSKVEYVNNLTKVCIICPEHGEFWQTPLAHVLNKQGCPKCSGRNLGQEEVIEKFKLVHGDKYDYSKVIFNKMHSKVCIICPEHGEFWQTPSKHLLGQGCIKCASEIKGRLNRLSREEFIERANKVHKNAYIYDYTEYTRSSDKIKIICPKHGEFTQVAYDHLLGHGCPHCANLVSRPEIEIYEFLSDIFGSGNVLMHNRNILGNGKEIDIYIPQLKLGIEYNGLRWHSEDFGKTSMYHLSKTEDCREKGIKLIQIFEDEYNYHKDIVYSKLKHLIKANTLPKIMGRKCEIKEISCLIANDFLEKNHIQGKCKATTYIGAFYQDILIGVMCFIKEKKEWNLNRFATDINYICQGVGGKLFKYFVRNYNPDEIKSFADRRWTIDEKDNIYIQLGFKLDSILKPDYRYVDKTNPTKRIHKFNLRKKEVYRKYKLPITLTESEMVEKLNLCKIWDCGLYKYIWKKD